MPIFCNTAILLGRLTRAPKVTATITGQLICETGLAISRKGRTAQGEEKINTCFVDLYAYDSTADLLRKQFRQGDEILIQGRLKNLVWLNKKTQKNNSRLVVEVIEAKHPNEQESSGPQ